MEKWIGLILLVLVVFVILWPGSGQNDPDRQVPPEVMEKFTEGMQTRPDGVLFRVVRKGTGRKPQPTDRVQVHYRGFFKNGRVFDSSYRVQKPAIFPVNGVIKGWTNVLLDMEEGDIWEVMIPANLAYGSTGAGNLIPPDTDLCFRIEFIKIY